MRHNIRNDEDGESGVDMLIRIAKDTCAPAMVRYLFRIRHKLASIIDDIWHWECIDDRLHLSQRSRAQALEEAMHTPCVCDGRWSACVAESLTLNGISPAELGRDIFAGFTGAAPGRRR